MSKVLVLAMFLMILWVKGRVIGRIMQDDARADAGYGETDEEPPSSPNEDNNFRSSERYWIASGMSFGRMPIEPARSARVRATLRIRSWARAEKFISSIACSR